MDPQLVAAHKAYLKAYKELNKEKIHDSYTKYFAANDKIKEYQQTYQRGYYERHKEEKKHKQRKYQLRH